MSLESVRVIPSADATKTSFKLKSLEVTSLEDSYPPKFADSLTSCSLGTLQSADLDNTVSVRSVLEPGNCLRKLEVYLDRLYPTSLKHATALTHLKLWINSKLSVKQLVKGLSSLPSPNQLQELELALCSDEVPDDYYDPEDDGWSDDGSRRRRRRCVDLYVNMGKIGALFEMEQLASLRRLRFSHLRDGSDALLRHLINAKAMGELHGVTVEW